MKEKKRDYGDLASQTVEELSTHTDARASNACCCPVNYYWLSCCSKMMYAMEWCLSYYAVSVRVCVQCSQCANVPSLLEIEQWKYSCAFVWWQRHRWVEQVSSTWIETLPVNLFHKECREIRRVSRSRADEIDFNRHMCEITMQCRLFHSHLFNTRLLLLDALCVIWARLVVCVKPNTILRVYVCVCVKSQQ